MTAMITFFDAPGFLGTRATIRSDLTLVLTLITAVMFTIGWQLAVRKHYEAHRWVQTRAVALNAGVVIFSMVTSFVTNILPGLPAKWNEGSYGVTTLHALVGAMALVLGLFVALRGNGLVPKRLRFTNYKLFMRAAYALYMVATLGGVILYVIVFVFGI
jgi:uncharacterized membrane protein YozB (DUF420 family)